MAETLPIHWWFYTWPLSPMPGKPSYLLLFPWPFLCPSLFSVCLSHLAHVLLCALRTVFQIISVPCHLLTPNSPPGLSSILPFMVWTSARHLFLDGHVEPPSWFHAALGTSGPGALFCISSFPGEKFNFLLLPSFTSLFSSFDTSFSFCSQTQWFSS